MFSKSRLLTISLTFLPLLLATCLGLLIFDKAFIVALIIWSLLGCTTTRNYEHFEDVAYQYYVIDENSAEPDAYFETKKEAESYKKYFEKHHTYKIVSVK